MPLRNGFTLMEVLVALVVAALLASGILAAQRYGFDQARDGDVLWEHMNLAQEAQLGRDPADQDDDTGWQRLTPSANRQWRISPAPVRKAGAGPWMMLTTRTPERTLEWTWPTRRKHDRPGAVSENGHAGGSR